MSPPVLQEEGKISNRDYTNYTSQFPGWGLRLPSVTYLSCWTDVFPWETVRRLKTFISLRGRLGGEVGGDRLASGAPESELQEKKNIFFNGLWMVREVKFNMPQMLDALFLSK